MAGCGKRKGRPPFPHGHGSAGFAFAAFLLLCACGRSPELFRVVPSQPQYLLRSPDKTATPFGELLSRYNGYVPGKDWLELRPGMELRVENAYYQAGASRSGLAGFLGTEIAQYRVEPRGELRLLSAQHMQDRPPGQAPVQELVSAAQRRYEFHRFYFEVLFKQSARGSVILGADSAGEIDQLAARLLTDPDAVCHSGSANCTAFPEACSVSLEMQILVNGKQRTVIWGSSLASVAASPQHVELLRRYAGHLVPVKVDARDPEALRLPLLPGDRVSWK